MTYTCHLDFELQLFVFFAQYTQHVYCADKCRPTIRVGPISLVTVAISSI